MVLWKETAFPLCRAMERRWKRNVVSRVSSVIMVIRLPISCVSGMAISCHVPAVSMVKDVCTGQFGVFVYLVLRCLLGCGTWFSCCAANVGLEHMCLVLLRPVVYWGAYAGIRRIPTSGFF